MLRTCTAIIKDENGSILLGKRNDSKKYSFIGGGMEKDETPEQCISREVLEEVGIHILPENFNLVDIKKVDNGNVTIFIFETTISSELPINVENDIDQEFEFANFYYIGWVLKRAELHIPRERNVVIDYLRANTDIILDNISQEPQDQAKELGLYIKPYKDGGAILRDSEQKIVLDTDSCSEVKKYLDSEMKKKGYVFVEKDNIQVDTISFKEKREIQKQIKQGYEDLVNASFKEKRTIQKEIKENYLKLKVDEKPSNGFDFKKAKEILQKEDLTLEDIEYFTDDRIEKLDKLRVENNTEAIELYDMLKTLNSSFTVDSIDFDSINFDMQDETLFDSVNSKQLKDLLTKAFPENTPNGSFDIKKRDEAIADLRKFIKRDNEANKIFMDLIEGIKD